MIEYRAFRNYDPPHILRLWQAAQLGSGAAQNLSNDMSFDLLNYSQPYFDREGLIVAVKDGRQIGFAHAGFACAETGHELDRASGVVCAVLVDPEHRRQGVGRELVRNAEQYLSQRGAREIYAGPGPGRDPFYFGLYGGAKPVGFLDSDPGATPFFQAIGYQPAERYTLLSRAMSARDPINFKVTMIRRKYELALCDRPDPCPWWWMVRYGRLDALFCVLVPKGGGPAVAAVTVVGLDAYLSSWREQAIGLGDLWVDPKLRGQGFGQALLLEAIKRLRQETISRITANVRTDDTAALARLAAIGFSVTDQGTVFKAPIPDAL